MDINEIIEDIDDDCDDIDGGSDNVAAAEVPVVVKTREEMRKTLRDKIKLMESKRAGRHAHSGLSANIDQNMNSRDKRKASKQTESRSVDDILEDFGIKSSDAKAKVVDAMRNGSVKTLNDLVGFVASLGGTMPKNNPLYSGSGASASVTHQSIDQAVTESSSSSSALTLGSHVAGQPRVPLRDRQSVNDS